MWRKRLRRLRVRPCRLSDAAFYISMTQGQYKASYYSKTTLRMEFTHD
jgi:hypothetical protein